MEKNNYGLQHDALYNQSPIMCRPKQSIAEWCPLLHYYNK